MSKVPENLDHILLGVSDLDAGIAWFEERSGIRAAVGGVHPGRGTRNALLSFGKNRYLEIIAPDPAQKTSGESMADELRRLKQPALVGWAVHTSDIAALVKKATAAGIKMEEIRDGSRARPDGKMLRWKACGLKNDFDGALPFFIQWDATSVHPSVDAPSGCSLEEFSLQTSDETVRATATGLTLGVEIKAGKKSGLLARIRGKKGSFDLI